jgi:hypothetical protein
LAVLSLFVLLGACGPSITYDIDRSIPIPKGAEVAFLGGTTEGSSRVDPNVQNDIVHRRVQNAIVQQLRAKGYQIVDSATGPEFIIRYFAGISQNTSLVTTGMGMGGMGMGGMGMMGPGMGWGPGWGWGWGMGGMGMGMGGMGMGMSTTQAVTTTDVQFVVDLVQYPQGNTAWRGIWQGDPGNRAPSQEKVDAGMQKLFRSLPSAK